ncbi:MAG: GDP-mannose 4,6-dehydratase [Phycisphaerae bacterium]|jgi:UDP-glucose 4-epimerase
MRALVTGGAGFIGSHLVEKLLQSGRSVTAIDDLSTGNLNNLQKVKDNKSFKFVRGNVRNKEMIDPLIKDCDVVYHLAAAVGVQLIVDEPVRTIETNIHGCEVVLESANRYGKKVLIASTSEVYGKSEAVPFMEDDDTVLGSTRFARWSYACSKAIDEFLAFAYHDQFNLPVVIVRIFNTVGPRQIGQYGMVVPRFVKSALKNEPVQIYGTGKQCRCFVHVSDVVGGFISLMQCEQAAGGIYNIGSDEEMSIEELADKIIALTGSKSEKRYISYEEAYGKEFDDMMRRVPSLEKINKVIGYKPKMSLEQTLQDVISDIKSKL